MTVEIRKAEPGDAAKLVKLMKLLGHATDISGTRRRLASLAQEQMPQLVAVDGDRIVGLCGLNRMTAIHRDVPVGRITILVVSEERRGCGLGHALVAAAEQQCRESGCCIVEVTSNDRLTEAHQFYRHLGYQGTSQRFAKML